MSIRWYINYNYHHVNMIMCYPMVLYYEHDGRCGYHNNMSMRHCWSRRLLHTCINNNIIISMRWYIDYDYHHIDTMVYQMWLPSYRYDGMLIMITVTSTWWYIDCDYHHIDTIVFYPIHHDGVSSNFEMTIKAHACIFSRFFGSQGKVVLCK